MTAPPVSTPPPDAAPGGTAVRTGPSRRSVLRRGRVVAALLLLVVVVAVVTVATAGSRGGLLDPRSARPEGTRALAVLLGERGVRVRETADAGQPGGPRTVVVAFPDRLTPAELRDLATEAAFGSDVVLIGPGNDALGALPGDLRRGTSGATGAIDPECDLPAAVGAGRAVVGGPAYVVGPTPAGGGPAGPITTFCYPWDDGAALAVVPHGQGRIVVLGSGTTLTNDRLDEEGDAALAIDLLDRHPRLAWVLTPSGRTGAVAHSDSFVDLLPDRVPLALLQLVVAVVLLGLWRGRRLGRPVREPLPVVVRGAETTEGRARLYEAARARGHAAAALRDGARDRLADVVGLGAGSAGVPDDRSRTLVTVVAERTGRSPGELTALLYGARAAGIDDPTGTAGEPADDAALIRLADDLDHLDRQVRHP